MTREKAIQMTKARIKVLKASKKTGNQEAAKALELLLETQQEIEILQATIDCLEWTIGQLSHSQPKEIAEAV